MDQAQYKIWLINFFICAFIDGSADSVDNIWLINLFICVFTDGSVDSVSPELKGEAVATSSTAYD